MQPGYGGRITVYNAAPGTTRRVYDSRPSSPIAGASNIPVRDLIPVEERGTTGVDAVAVDVTVVSPLASGHLRTYHGTSSGTSTHNFTVGEIRANTVYLPVSSDGTITVYDGTSNTTHVVVDVFGWFPRGT